MNVSVSGSSNIQNLNVGENLTVYSRDQNIHNDNAGATTVEGNHQDNQHSPYGAVASQNDEQINPRNVVTAEIVTTVARFFNEPSDFLYDMTNRGFVYIINNVEFDHLNDRHGFDVDFNNLRTFFLEKVMWREEDVQFQKNLTVKEMQDIIIMLRRYDYNNHGAFFLIILSHGNKFGICGKDSLQNDSVTVLDVEKDILPYFSASNCPSLADKPKVLIMQACRGDMDDNGTPLETDADMAEPPTRYRRQIPDMSEYLLCYPCVPGYTSIRNVESGTYFIQSLVKIFNAKYDKEDILTMLLRVNYDVSRARNSLRTKQMPSHDNRLTRKTYFHSYFVKMQAVLREKKYI